MSKKSSKPSAPLPIEIIKKVINDVDKINQLTIQKDKIGQESQKLKDLFEERINQQAASLIEYCKTTKDEDNNNIFHLLLNTNPPLYYPTIEYILNNNLFKTLNGQLKETNDAGRTPLHFAAILDEKGDITSNIISHTDLNHQIDPGKNATKEQATQKGFNELQLASRDNNLPVVKILLEKNQNANYINNGHPGLPTALDLACYQKNTEVIDLLLSQSPLIFSKTISFCTSHPESMDQDQNINSVKSDILQKILNKIDKKDPPRIINNEEGNPLHHAIVNYNPDLVKILIKNGANLNLIYEGKSPMEFALSNLSSKGIGNQEKAKTQEIIDFFKSLTPSKKKISTESKKFGRIIEVKREIFGLIEKRGVDLRSLMTLKNQQSNEYEDLNKKQQELQQIHNQNTQNPGGELAKKYLEVTTNIINIQKNINNNSTKFNQKNQEFCQKNPKSSEEITDLIKELPKESLTSQFTFKIFEILIENNDILLLNHLCSSEKVKLDINCTDNQGYSPIYHAAINQHEAWEHELQSPTSIINRRLPDLGIEISNEDGTGSNIIAKILDDENIKEKAIYNLINGQVDPKILIDIAIEQDLSFEKINFINEIGAIFKDQSGNFLFHDFSDYIKESLESSRENKFEDSIKGSQIADIIKSVENKEITEKLIAFEEAGYKIHDGSVIKKLIDNGLNTKSVENYQDFKEVFYDKCQLQLPSCEINEKSQVKAKSKPDKSPSSPKSNKVASPKTFGNHLNQ